MDSPSAATVSRGLVRFEGWALDRGRPLAAVDVVINETTVIPARLGVERRDVPGNLGQPDAAIGCGWAVTVDLAVWPESDLRVQVIAQTESGERTQLIDTTLLLRDALEAGDIEDPLVRQLPAPVWTWELPDFLADTTGEVIDTVSPHERMPADDSYLDVGRSALKAIRFAQLAAGKEDFSSILDMPSGHGRVLRWLKAAYPEARLTACDLLTDGVDFCAETFGATPVYSTQFPTSDVFADRYDLIFVGSLLTHVDVPNWDHLIELWHSLLRPDGLLVVTTHGELAAERMRAGHNYGYADPAVKRSLRAYDHAGFMFLEERLDNIDYGITLARADWTIQRLLRQSDFRLVMYGEALWHQHQDVAAVVRRPIAVT